MFMIYMRLLKNKILVSKIVHEDIEQVYIYKLRTIHILTIITMKQKLLDNKLELLIKYQKELSLLFTVKISLKPRDLLPKVKQFMISILLYVFCYAHK